MWFIQDLDSTSGKDALKFTGKNGSEALRIYSSIFVCMIVYVCCGGTEPHCAKWPVTEVFHVNPMIHTEPHVTVARAHTRTHTPGAQTDAIHRPMKARAHTYARAQAEHASEIVRFDDVARRHLRQCIQYGFRPGCSRKKSCDVFIEIITILCFTTGVLFYWYRKWRRTPNKQTAKVEGRLIAPTNLWVRNERHVTG